MRYPGYIEQQFVFPDFLHVRLQPPSMALKDPVKELEAQLPEAFNRVGIKKGQTVAIGVGSRGTAHISSFVRCLCQNIRNIGAIPCIIPSMGSHGSATASGQVKVLEKLGITREYCDAPIFPEMDAVEIGQVYGDVPVFYSSKALEADHAICINRVKPHTKFRGPMESGLYKMVVVGMGKHQGALTFHNQALKYGFYDLLKEMGDTIIAKSNICLGIGVVEDHYDQTMAIQVIPAGEIPEQEPLLLEKAKTHFPKLPFSELDVLVIRQIGKEISGAGMDSNVTGRNYDLMENDFSQNLMAKRLVILNLSQKTAGNAIGLGNADIITEKVFQNMDYEATVMNALTSMSLRKAFIPIRLPTEEKAIQAAYQTIGPSDPDVVRAVIIQDTMHTTDFLISRSLVEEVKAIPHAQILGSTPLTFTSQGDLIHT
jgi:hypothetical protein